MYLINSYVVKVIGINMIFNTIFISNIKSLKSAMNIKKITIIYLLMMILIKGDIKNNYVVKK
jgi:hypothetical protein